MTLPRWLAALVVATGLLAMHGITASTAAAAVPCGVTAPHGHHDSPAALAGDAGTAVPQLSAASVDVAHGGALCLAVLVGGLLLGLLLRTRWRGPRSLLATGPLRPVRHVGRPPPGSLLPLLCVSRT